MPFAVGGNSRIRTNTPAENAYNSLEVSNRDISLRQLRLSTGRRINSAADDVSGYIAARALMARNSTLKAAVNIVGDAKSLTNILMDSLESIVDQLQKIKESTMNASSGTIGTDERVALAKASFRMAQQISTIVESTVFGGRQLLDGSFSTEFIIGAKANNSLLSISLNMMKNNLVEYNLQTSKDFMLYDTFTDFAGISNFKLADLNDVSANNLGIFNRSNISKTLTSITGSIINISKVAAYVGGIVGRLDSQEDLLKNQIVNYNAAISRIEDADVAKEQLELIKSQFLQQSSLISLSQANVNPQAFLQLLQGG